MFAGPLLNRFRNFAPEPHEPPSTASSRPNARPRRIRATTPIRAHWQEILRIAASIKTGAVSASLIMRQLASYPRQNGVAAALRPRRAGQMLALTRPSMLPSVILNTSAPGAYLAFAAQGLAYVLPYRRFADTLANANARLGADAVRYSFIAVDFHNLLFAGLDRRTGTQELRTAKSPQ